MVQGYTYAGFKTQLATVAVVDETDVNFLQNLPSAIDTAELRINRELDLLSSVSSLTGFSLIANQRLLNVPIATYVLLQEINVITPVGTSDPDSGVRNPCLPVSKEFLDYTYPSNAGASLPTFFAPLSQNRTIFGAWPDQNYSLELVGVVRPISLSVANPTTFISTFLPDLFFAAAMVYISGYQRNFGRASDDPQMAVSWEGYYQSLKAPAMQEENRKKFTAAAWTSMSPAVSSSPTRG